MAKHHQSHRHCRSQGIHPEVIENNVSGTSLVVSAIVVFSRFLKFRKAEDLLERFLCYQSN